MDIRVSNIILTKGVFSIAKVSVLNNLHKPKRDFIISVLWLFLSIKGKINFLQLARYGQKGEQHFRRQFSERFDFAGFNAELIKSCASKHLVLALDPTHLPKTDKKTYGKDFFWSGCAGAVKPGLEFNGLAAVDMKHFTLVQETDNCQVFSATVWVKAFHRKVALVVCESKDSSKKSRRLYFSTDTELEPLTILDYYAARFQIEFLYRDAKQHTGLCDCQARSREKLNFHVNASLTAVNIAKAEHWLSLPKEERGSFSMANIKTLYHNELLLKRFFSVCRVKPTHDKKSAQSQRTTGYRQDSLLMIFKF